MRYCTTVLLVVFFWFYSTESITLYWTGAIDNNWWNKGNWDCNGCLPTADDDVIISEDHVNISSSKNVLIPALPLAKCHSLILNGTVTVNITALEVGVGGINASSGSSITLVNLTSHGNIVVQGNCSCQSGMLQGTGDYTFINLTVSQMCHIYSHVHVQRDVFIKSPEQNIIEIHPNAWLIVDGSLVISSSLNIIGNISANTLFFNADKNLVLNGNYPQDYKNLEVYSGALSVFTPINVVTLTISGGTLDGIVNVEKLILGEKVIILGNGNVSVSQNAHMSGPLTLGGSLRFKTGATAQFVTCSINLLSSNSKVSIINEGQGIINGNFISSNTFIGGNGSWTVSGTWLVQGPCGITGNIILKDNSVLKIEDSNNYPYSFGGITGGSINGSGGGIFTAKVVSVNSFNALFKSVTIDTLSSKNYTSCASTVITKINKVDNLILEEGNYKFSVQNLINDISYLKLSDGVVLELNNGNIDVTIQTFDFLGGSFSSQGNNVQCNLVNMIGNYSKKFLDDTLLPTNTLDWSKCDKIDCGMSQWSNIASIHCVCDCTHCKNSSCAPCLNGDCSPCRDGCSCGNGQNCNCDTDSVSKKKFLSINK